MRLEADWLTSHGPQSVMAALRHHDAYFVGGCVRNALLGTPPGDIDIATSARPDQITQAAQAAGLRVVPTGLDHGTVTILVNGEGYEVTTFRRDVATDGRRAVVAFAETIAQDALRRDFTMNALYAEADGTLHDPLRGMPDLLARRVRFIENADRRIAEDYLRILRFFRFHAIYGDAAQGLDAEGLAACAAGAQGIAKLSKERIGAEMIKLLSAQDPSPSLAAMAQSGVLMQILPGADSRTLPVVVHLEQCMRLAPRWLARLASLGIGLDPAPLLRLTRAQAKHLRRLRTALQDATPETEVAYRFGIDLGLDVALVRAASLEQDVAEDLANRIAEAAQARFPVTSADLPGLSGKALGNRLDALEAKWIRSGFRLDAKTLLSDDEVGSGFP